MGIDRDRALRLLVAHRAGLLGYIRSLVGDATLAEDVLQDMSVLVVRKCGQVGSEAGFLPWLRRAARYEALNAVRRRRAQPLALDADVLDLVDRAWRERDGDRPADRLEALEACLGDLTPRSRRLVEMRFSGGLTGAELADRLACPVNTVYVGLSRIYGQLGRCIEARLARREAADV